MPSDDRYGAGKMIDAIHLVDAILVLVGLEFIALIALKRFRGFGPPLDRMAATLASGGFLLCATRAALSSEQAFMMAALAAAGIAHGIDMKLRWL